MAQYIADFLQSNPVTLPVVVAAMLLALVGLWYIVYHHLQVILITLLCTAGLLSGGVVMFRGAQHGMKDLMIIGLFLMIVFPVIFYQALQLSQAGPPKPAPKPDDKLQAKKFLY